MSADPYVGTVFAGRFRVERALAEGGMGAVYVALQQPAGRRVALKVIKDVANAGADLVARFEREMAVLSQLNHPNIVTMYDCGVHEGTLFVVMELMAGHSLRDEIERVGRVEWPRAIRFARDVARALMAVHVRSVIHRDLKPENIFVCETPGHDELVKLLDFGIVRHDAEEAPRLTMTGGFIGTPGYISPEQLHGHVATAQSDLYALGVILYEMLTGTFPFEAPTIQAMAVKQLVDPIPSATQAAPDAVIPVELDALVARLMSRDPQERPAGARALLDAFEGILAAVRAAPSGSQSLSLPTAPPTSTARSPGLLDALSPAAPTEAGHLPLVPPVTSTPRHPPTRRRLALAAAVAGMTLAVVVVVALMLSSRGDPVSTAPVMPAVRQPTPGPASSQPEPAPAGTAVKKPIETAPQPTTERELPDGFVLIPAARFTRGSASQRNQLELPMKTVAVRDFAMMKTEVSTGEFQKWIDATYPGVAVPGVKTQPVVRVAADMAQKYCAWRVDGGRLPTEDEWELAARSERSWRFPWGDTANPACLRGDGASGPVDVNALPCSGNPAGVLHLVGNVWELTATVPDAPALAGYHIARGGSFATPASMLDANSRAAMKEPDDKTGFRCVVSR